MKNNRTLIVLVLLILIGVGFFIFNKINNKEEDPKSLTNDINTVLIDENLSNKEIDIDNITISDITLNEKNEIMYFKISSLKKISQIKLTIVLYDSKKLDDKQSETITIKDIEDEKIIRLDLKNQFNNPTKLKFIVEK